MGLVLANPLLINNPIRTTNILDLMFNLVNKPIIFLNGKCFNNMKVKSKITQNLEGYTKNYALDLKRLLPICLVFLMSFLNASYVITMAYFIAIFGFQLIRN